MLNNDLLLVGGKRNYTHLLTVGERPYDGSDIGYKSGSDAYGAISPTIMSKFHNLPVDVVKQNVKPNYNGYYIVDVWTSSNDFTGVDGWLFFARVDIKQFLGYDITQGNFVATFPSKTPIFTVADVGKTIPIWLANEAPPWVNW